MQKAFSSPNSKKMGRLLSGATKFLSWWSASLLSLVPARQTGRDDATLSVLTVTNPQPSSRDEQARKAWRDQLNSDMLNAVKGLKQISLELAPTLVFERELRLPEVPGMNIRELAHASIGGLPFTDQEIVRTYTVGDEKFEDDVRSVIEYTAKRELIVAYIEAGKENNIEIVKIGVAGVSDQPECDFLLAPGVDPNSDGGAIKWLAAAAVLVLLLSFFWAQNIRQEIRSEQLDSNIAAIQSEALQIRQAISTVSQHSSTLAQLVEERQQSADPLDTLLRLTSSMDDGSYLSTIDLEGRQIRITGLSQDAAALFAAIESEPEFQDVAFASATTQEESLGLERFGLVMTLAIETEREGQKR